MDPQIFSKALWVGWQEMDDPPSGEVDAGLLGGILRDNFGAGLSSISDAQLNHKAKFTIVGVKPVDYDKGMKLTRHHTARGKSPGRNPRSSPTPHGPPKPTGNTPPAKPTVEDEDRSTATSMTRRSKWTSRRPRTRKENQRPSTSGGTARAARTGPRPAAAALGIAVIARRQGVAVPTATSGWTPGSTF